MNKQKPKTFLSYAREDMGMAKQIYNDLKRYGLNVWLDTELLSKSLKIIKKQFSKSESKYLDFLI